jgi:glycosyltransferase involved in cell wall biosynthesis
MTRVCARPKIALYEPSGEGGIAHYTFELAEALAQAGSKVTLLTSENYELRDLPRSFDVWFVVKASRLKRWIPAGAAAPPPALSSTEPSSAAPASWSHAAIVNLKTVRLMLVALKTVALLWASGIRIVHVQWLLDRRADLLFVRILSSLGFKVVYTVHDVLPHDEYTDANRRYFGTLYGYADKLIVHGNRNRDELLQLLPVRSERVAVVPHGARTVFTDHFCASLADARAELDIPHDARVILFFGLIKRYKGLEYLLEAFDFVRQSCGNVVLVIAGKIYEGDRTVYRHYSNLLREYQGRSDIRFADGYIPINKVMNYFVAADVVVMPYVKASQSGVLLSAFAAGKPVVVTDTGGLGDVVRDSGGGIVVPPQDSPALAEACIALLTNTDLARSMADAAKRSAETSYSWANISRTTLRLYESLTESQVPLPSLQSSNRP